MGTGRKLAPVGRPRNLVLSELFAGVLVPAAGGDALRLECRENERKSQFAAVLFALPSVFAQRGPEEICRKLGSKSGSISARYAEYANRWDVRPNENSIA